MADVTLCLDCNQKNEAAGVKMELPADRSRVAKCDLCGRAQRCIVRRTAIALAAMQAHDCRCEFDNEQLAIARHAGVLFHELSCPQAMRKAAKESPVQPIPEQVPVTMKGYYVREEMCGYVLEVGFQTHAELQAYVDRLDDERRGSLVISRQGGPADVPPG